MDYKYIGITGKKQSGKDSVASFIHSNLSTKYDFCRIGFADALKRIVANELLEVSVKHLNKIKNVPEVRHLLQRIGTEYRDKDISYWINRLEEGIKIKLLQSNTVICIPDVRYINEAEWIKSKGGMIIRIIRSGLDASGNYIERMDIDHHSSETEQDKIEATCHIRNTSTLDKLEWEVKCVMEIVRQHLHL